MKEETKLEITKISKEFASGFKDTIGDIGGSGWLIVDPLSGYLNALGYPNTLQQIPARMSQHQVLIMTFEDGTRFIPSGGDLPHPGEDWMWIEPAPTAPL